MKKKKPQKTARKAIIDAIQMPYMVG